MKKKKIRIFGFSWNCLLLAIYFWSVFAVFQNSGLGGGAGGQTRYGNFRTFFVELGIVY